VARENVARHAEQMRGLADHLRMRCRELAEINGCGLANREGWTHEGGMGWDHEVPGCGPAAGGGTETPGACAGDCDQERARDGSCTDGTCDGTPDQDRDRDGSCTDGTCDGTPDQDRVRDGTCGDTGSGSAAA
jgi:hypothetical protein